MLITVAKPDRPKRRNRSQSRLGLPWILRLLSGIAGWRGRAGLRRERPEASRHMLRDIGLTQPEPIRERSRCDWMP